MADPSPFPIPDVPRPLVLAEIAVQTAEVFFQIDDPAELAQRARSRSWAVIYATSPGTVILPNQQVTEADLPMLTALLDELFASDPVPPYVLQALVDGAARRVQP